MPRLLVFGLFILLGTALAGQEADSLRLQRWLPFAGNYITDDPIGNIYLISGNNTLVKYDSSGRQIATYSNLRLGPAASVDAANPFKVLLWFPDFQTALLLDRTLNELGRLYFPDAGLGVVRAVATASDGNVWAFDESVSKLVRLDWNGTVLQESQPLRDFFSRSFSPTRMQDDGRRVCLLDPAGGICLLNTLGGVEQALPFAKASEGVLKGDWLWQLETDRLFISHLQHFQEGALRLPAWCAGASGRWLSARSLFVGQGGRTAQFKM